MQEGGGEGEKGQGDGGRKREERGRERAKRGKIKGEKKRGEKDDTEVCVLATVYTDWQLPVIMLLVVRRCLPPSQLRLPVSILMFLYTLSHQLHTTTQVYVNNSGSVMHDETAH